MGEILSSGLQTLSRLDGRPHLTTLKPGWRRIIMLGSLRRSYDPPRALCHARRVDPTSPAAGHHFCAQGKWRPQSPASRPTTPGIVREWSHLTNRVVEWAVYVSSKLSHNH